ncbi:MAG: carbohydrate kinase family protein [Patescibacteria group bacterium]|nr:carbohydrate kinase family protein [Patescibacteria group bacterium]
MSWLGGLDVLTIGAGTRDVFIKSKHFEKKSDPKAPAGFDACFPMGSKIPLDDIYLETGGGATNAAVTFRQLGFKTACMCRVGADSNGNAVKEALSARGINTKFIQTDSKHQTSYAVIILAGSGQRSILVYRGASNFLDTNECDWNKINPSWFYLTSLGGKLPQIKTIFSKVKSDNIKVAWNPGNSELKLGLKKLQTHIQNTDLLFLNREESALLTEKPPRHLIEIIKQLGHLPKQALVITDGPNGAYAYNPKDKSLLHAKAIPGKRINTTGAGDAFGSGFTASFIKDGDIRKALCVGSYNSIGVITTMGAKVGILESFPGSQKMKRCKIKQIKL